FNESSLFQKFISAVYYLGLRKIAVADMNGHVAYQDKWYPLLNKSGIYWFRHGFYELFQSKATNKFLSGNFEAPNFFEEYRDILIEEFTPKYPPIEKNKEIYAAISSTNSVCITIRRGDYENDSEIKKLHSVCDKNYFQKAIEIMKEKVNEPVFFMFSDDIEWVKKNIDTGATTYYEDGDDPVWEKLRMMSSCKHFIISNSSFSWWSQWLSSNLGKIVISPSKWYNNDYMSPLIDESWIRI
ncbi:TPA: alpha-1,2-fucosyltransferase, partial [Streptococcus suis]|nr:alpha-1,2-fucosyltransferase [Streptococcus suis]